MVIVVYVYTISNQSIFAQVKTPINNHEVINENGQPILLGHCSISAFQKDNFKDWYNANYNSFVIDTATVELIKPLLKKKRITIFMGTWCGDSKQQVPRMIKMLLAAGFDTSHLSIITVGNDAEMYKKSPQGEEIGLNIRRVPTIIIYNKKKEIGRFIEFPVVSLEKDILRILLQDGYIPNYANLKE